MLYQSRKMKAIVLVLGIFLVFTTCKKDEVKKGPDASFTATPTTGTVPLVVNFTDQSTNSPTSWQWDFGDGITSTLQNPGHTFNESGIYTVQLTVTNSAGSDTKQLINFINVSSAGISPVANFTADSTAGTIPLTVNFTDQSTNSPTNWEWDFGDGSTSTIQNPDHTFNVAGAFTVQLKVTNNYGSDTELKNNYIIITSSGSTGTITDIDGNVYPTVVIGSQEWMAENLKVTHYRNGEEIPNIMANTEWCILSSGAYCWYNNDTSWKDLYGALYNWYAVDNSRGLCPDGWHVPADNEFTILTDLLGGEDLAGGKLKSARTSPDIHPRWDSPNTGATNESGFSVLPGSIRGNSGMFDYIGTNCYFWSSTESTSNVAWYRKLYFYQSSVGRSDFGKRIGGSVRCLRD